MKEGCMKKKALILLMVGVLGLGISGCAGEKAMVKAVPSQIQPVKAMVDTVERLNAIGAKPPNFPIQTMFWRKSITSILKQRLMMALLKR
jgi:hypothetical protein